MVTASKPLPPIPPLEIYLTESLRAFEADINNLGHSHLRNALRYCSRQFDSGMSEAEVEGFLRRITEAAGWPEAL